MVSFQITFSKTKQNSELNQNSTRKVMATVFWNRKCVLLGINFIPRGQTINSYAYCQTLYCLLRAMHNKWYEILSRGINFVLVHTRLYSSFTSKFWVVFISASAIHRWRGVQRFPFIHKLKEFLGGRQFEEDDVVKEIVTEWFKNWC